MAFDFQAELESFTESVSTGDPIKSIYDILPIYNPQQQKMLFVINYFVEKWDLKDVRALLTKAMEIQSRNKNLDMLTQKSLTALLSAYTQNELVRGIKVQAFNDTSNSSGS